MGVCEMSHCLCSTAGRLAVPTEWGPRELPQYAAPGPRTGRGTWPLATWELESPGLDHKDSVWLSLVCSGWGELILLLCWKPEV